MYVTRMVDEVRGDLVRAGAVLTGMAIAASSVAFSPIVSAQPANPAAPQAFRPYDWVTGQEATDIFGKPVTPESKGEAAASSAPQCFYAASGDRIGVGISSELLLPGASATDADAKLANAAAEPGAQAIGGLGVNAVCVFERQVAPPATTILVLLDGSRIYRATAPYEYCDTSNVSPGRRLPGSRLTTTASRCERNRYEACFDPSRSLARRTGHIRVGVADVGWLLVVIEFDCYPIQSG